MDQNLQEDECPSQRLSGLTTWRCQITVILLVQQDQGPREQGTALRDSSALVTKRTMSLVFPVLGRIKI